MSKDLKADKEHAIQVSGEDHSRKKEEQVQQPEAKCGLRGSKQSKNGERAKSTEHSRCAYEGPGQQARHSRWLSGREVQADSKQRKHRKSRAGPTQSQRVAGESWGPAKRPKGKAQLPETSRETR